MTPDPSFDVVLAALDERPGVTRLPGGKVRERFVVPTDTGDALLLVASDRISAYDAVLPTPIPDKGRVLTGLTDFWLDHLAGVVPDHRIATGPDAMPDVVADLVARLDGRAMLCRRARVVPFECVARGYLAGSGWTEYAATGTVCGVELPSGLREGDRLPEPIFTPATKAEAGHDVNVDLAAVADAVGLDLANQLRDVTLDLYGRAAEHAARCGILLADTKLELGFVDGALTLVDEVCTPDSSRFWPADRWEPGGPQPSFDKQYVRDWLTTSGWDRTPPAPQLPDDVVARTRERYLTAFEHLAGRPLPPPRQPVPETSFPEPE